jgi:dihydroorotase
MLEQPIPKIHIQGGRVIDPANHRDQVIDLYLADGRVVGIDTAPDSFSADICLPVDGLVVTPGFVDLCARLREPGLEHKATIASETKAAAAAGITTLCCPPDTKPVIDTPAVARLIQQIAQRCGFARVLPAGALTQHLEGVQISEMAALKQAGCPVLSHADRAIRNTRIQRRALEYAATYGLTCFLHPADSYLSEGGLVHEGRISTRLGLAGIPRAAETVAVARDLALAEQTGARIHFRGLSTARATLMLAEAHTRGIAATADVSAHHLFLTEDDIDGFDTDAYVLPPLRNEDDRTALRHAVANGIVTAICSDHQPHEADAKLMPFPHAEPGISSLETLLPLTLQLVRMQILTWHTALSCLTCHPARILGLELGQLSLGAVADICIFDPERRWQPSTTTWYSRGRNTPFWQHTLYGQVIYTLLGGRVIYEQRPEHRQ